MLNREAGQKLKPRDRVSGVSLVGEASPELEKKPSRTGTVSDFDRLQCGSPHIAGIEQMFMIINSYEVSKKGTQLVFKDTISFTLLMLHSASFSSPHLC